MPSPPLAYGPLILILALALIGLVGLRAAWRMKGPGAAEYFLAGRSVGWLPLGVSLAVTTVWGIWAVSVGMPLTFGVLGWGVLGALAVAGLLLFGLVLVPHYRTSEVSTIAAYLGERYGKDVGVAVAVFTIVLTLVVRIPFTLFVGSRLLNATMGWEVMSSSILVIVVPGLLVVAGGYHAAFAAQQAGGVAAAIGLTVVALMRVSPAPPIAHGMLPDEGPLWVLVVAGMAVMGLWYMCIDQFVVQRGLAARSDAAARRGTGVAIGLVALGTAALAAGVERSVGPDAPAAINDGIANGVAGAAIVACAVAALCSYFMSIATVFTLDIFPSTRRANDDAALILVGRLANTGVVILAILAASSVALMGGGSIRWMTIALTVAVPPVAAVTLIGLLSHRMHGRGALWALCAGWVAGLLYAGVAPEGIGGLMQGVLATFAFSAVVLVVVSLASAPRRSFASEPTTCLEKGLEGRKP